MALPTSCLSMTIPNYEHKISAKVEARIADLAERLYNYIPDVCWMTERNLAAALNTTIWQLRNAKAFLLKTGRIEIDFRPNGRRLNPVHTLIKTNPINQYSSDEMPDESNSRINWCLFDNLSVSNLNTMSVEDKLDFYKEMRLPFFPLHYPKFNSENKAFCSCGRGQKCDSIGKHPAIAYSELDFSNDFTFRLMKSFWVEDMFIDNVDCNNSYNVGFKTDDFLVIDVDFRKGGAYSLGVLEETYGALPRNLMVKTGNGFHIYTSGNKNIKTDSEILGFRGIDIRSKGSFIVAPFSDHFTGSQYEWLSISQPEPMPLDLIAALQPNEKQLSDSTKNGAEINTSSPLPSYYDSDFIIPKGARNSMLFRLASRERGRGAEQAAIFNYLKLMNSKHTIEPLDEKELAHIAKSVMKFPPENQKPSSDRMRQVYKKDNKDLTRDYIG